MRLRHHGGGGGEADGRSTGAGIEEVVVVDLEWDVSMRVGPGRIFLPPAAHGWGRGLMERGEVEKMPRWLQIRFKMQFVLVFNIFILLRFKI